MDNESEFSQQLLSDTDLVEDFRVTQDPETLERIVVRYGALVMGVCRRHTKNQHDAEDAFQATFVILVSNIAKLRNPESIGSWLFGIAYRVSTRLNKKATRQPESVESQGTEIVVHVDPFELVNAKFVLEKTDDELQRLPEQLKRPMILRYLMGKSNQEIAMQLQTSVAAIEGRLKRAKRSLRLRLTRCGITLGSALIALHRSQEVAAGWLDTRMANSHAAGEFDLVQTENVPIEITQLAREETVMISSIIGSKSAIGIAASVALITTSIVLTASSANGDGNGSSADKPAANNSQTVLRLAQASASNRRASTGTIRTETANADPFAAPAQPKTAGDDPFDFGSQPAGGGDPFGAATANNQADPTSRPRLRSTAGDPRETVRQRSAEEGVQDMKIFPPDHQRVRDELQKKTQLNFFDTSLGDAIDFLKRSHQVNMRIDQPALSESGVTIDTPVQNITISGITFHNGLDLVLEEFDLTFVPRGNLIFITTPEKANKIHETHVYRLPKLSVSPLELTSLIRLNVTPDLWDPSKGHGKITHLKDRIVVRQTFRGHQELKELLKQLIESDENSKIEKAKQ